MYVDDQYGWFYLTITFGEIFNFIKKLINYLSSQYDDAISFIARPIIFTMCMFFRMTDESVYTFFVDSNPNIGYTWTISSNERTKSSLDTFFCLAGFIEKPKSVIQNLWVYRRTLSGNTQWPTYSTGVYTSKVG